VLVIAVEYPTSVFFFKKSGNILHPMYVPCEAGRIHHVRFPGSLDCIRKLS